MNEKKPSNLEKIINYSSKSIISLLESDVDEQLLLTISFSGIIKPHSISLFIPKKELERAPKDIKIFNNSKEIDFDSIEKHKTIQTYHLNEKEDWKVTANGENELMCLLKTHTPKYTNTTSITLLIENNLGGKESSALCGIHILGTTNKKITTVEDIIE